MALHEFQVWIEYDERPDYPALTVIVKSSGNPDKQFEGKTRNEGTLKRLLNKANQYILACEHELGMIYATRKRS